MIYIGMIYVKLFPWILSLQNVSVNLRTVAVYYRKGTGGVLFCPNKGLLLKACSCSACLWPSNPREERKALWKPSLYVIYSKHIEAIRSLHSIKRSGGLEFISDSEITGSWNPYINMYLQLSFCCIMKRQFKTCIKTIVDDLRNWGFYLWY